MRARNALPTSKACGARPLCLDQHRASQYQSCMQHVQQRRLVCLKVPQRPPSVMRTAQAAVMGAACGMLSRSGSSSASLGKSTWQGNRSLPADVHPQERAGGVPGQPLCSLALSRPHYSLSRFQAQVACAGPACLPEWTRWRAASAGWQTGRCVWSPKAPPRAAGRHPPQP